MQVLGCWFLVVGGGDSIRIEFQEPRTKNQEPRTNSPLQLPSFTAGLHNAGMHTVRIATRKSPLALWQSEYVADLLRDMNPGLQVVLVPMSTRGDEVLDRSLAAIGGKGLFLKELEIAMQRGEADCAVHSLKDVPMQLDAPFALPAILPRADAADAFISNTYASLDALPQGARVGTSSLRRQAQLRARRPDLQLLDLRGNVNTRLAKLDAGEYDAIVLACAGIERLGFESRIRTRLPRRNGCPRLHRGQLHWNRVAMTHGCTPCSPRWTTRPRAPAWKRSAR